MHSIGHKQAESKNLAIVTKVVDSNLVKVQRGYQTKSVVRQSKSNAGSSEENVNTRLVAMYMVTTTWPLVKDSGSFNFALVFWY